MKHKRKKDKRFRNQSANVATSGLHTDTTPMSGQSVATVAAPASANAETSAAMTAPESARCVSENFMTTPGQASLFVEPLGQRLAAAREARGWSRAEAASRLRLPLRIVQTIEADEFEKIGHGIYLRGYLNNYARLVGVPADAVDEVMRQHDAAPPQLVASGRVSHSRFLFDRYSGAALYVVLTGVIFVPLIMFAMNMGGDVGARLLPLDAPGSASQSTAKLDSVSPAETSSVATSPLPVPAEDATVTAASVPANAQSDSPLLASFAPIANPSRSQAGDAAVLSNAHNIRLTLAEASWVEIADADGKRLEYGILPAGSVRNYQSDKALDVRIGNTTGARLEINGEAQDMAPFNHGNVAHFRLFAAGKTISRTDS